MENFDANAGTNKLANVLSDRMRRENDTSLCLDFGEIRKRQPHHKYFPSSNSERSIFGMQTRRRIIFYNKRRKAWRTFKRRWFTWSHNYASTDKAWDRVLVAWVMNEACVIDVVTGS